jgi:hypothetical protein
VLFNRLAEQALIASGSPGNRILQNSAQNFRLAVSDFSVAGFLTFCFCAATGPARRIESANAKLSIFIACPLSRRHFRTSSLAHKG